MRSIECHRQNLLVKVRTIDKEWTEFVVLVKNEMYCQNWLVKTDSFNHRKENVKITAK